MPEPLPEQQLDIRLVINDENEDAHPRAPAFPRDAAVRGRTILNSVNQHLAIAPEHHPDEWQPSLRCGINNGSRTSHHRGCFRSFTPGSSPFVNSTPAASRAL